MALIRAGFPVVVGLILIELGVIAIGSAFLHPAAGAEFMYALGGSVRPIAIGLGMLVLSVAIRRESRLGLLLGVVVALGFVVLAIWFILSVLPGINAGPFNFVAPAIAVAGVLAALSAAYAALLLRARATFAPHWQPVDRGTALALGFLILAESTLGFATNALATRAAADQAAAEADAQALVDSTSLEVHVVDVTLDLASTPSVVQHLTLDVTIRSATAYQLREAPRLCLSAIATYQEGGKAGALCWGAEDPGLALEGPLADLTLKPQGVIVRVDLDRAATVCAYTVGRWSAALLLSPTAAGSLSTWKQTSFTIDGGAPVQDQAACAGLAN